MTQIMNDIMTRYIDEIKIIYGMHLRKIILYGSYARGDFTENSDIDLMILLDISDLDIKEYRHKLSVLCKYRQGGNNFIWSSTMTRLEQGRI